MEALATAELRADDEPRLRRFHALYRGEFAFVWSAAQHLGVPPGMVDEVVQDVFLKLNQYLSNLDPERLAPWLFTVCKNRALDHQRKHQRVIIMEVQTLDLEVSDSPRPGDEMQSRETAAALRSLGVGQGDRVRRKLSWFSPITDNALFVNQRGQRAAEVSLDSLARMLVNGQARMVTSDRGRLVDRAWQAAVNTLRSFAGRGEGAQPNGVPA